MRDRVREDGRIVRTDPITGVEVLSPLDPEIMEMTISTMQEMEKEAEEYSKRLRDPAKALKAIREYVPPPGDYIEPEDVAIRDATIERVVYASYGEGFGGSEIEIIFIGSVAGKRDVYRVTAYETRGSFYEPPDGDFEWDTLDGYIEWLERFDARLKNGLTMKDRKLLEHLIKIREQVKAQYEGGD